MKLSLLFSKFVGSLYFFNEQFFPYNFEIIKKYVNFRDHCHVKNILHLKYGSLVPVYYNITPKVLLFLF